MIINIYILLSTWSLLVW